MQNLFDALRTDITFAGYRFAARDYRTLTQFMDQRRTLVMIFALQKRTIKFI